MIRLTGQQIFDSTQVLATIINEKRPLPTKGVYRVTRMHAKLFPEFTLLNDQRTAKIISYEHKQTVQLPGLHTKDDPLGQIPREEEQDAVPDDKMNEFVSWWKELASVETDVNIEPLPIDQLGEGNLSYAEFATLGDLVAG